MFTEGWSTRVGTKEMGIIGCLFEMLVSSFYSSPTFRTGCTVHLKIYALTFCSVLKESHVVALFKSVTLSTCGLSWEAIGSEKSKTGITLTVFCSE